MAGQNDDQLKNPKGKVNFKNFSDLFGRIKSGLYYLFKVNAIDGYTLTNHSDVIYVNVKTDKTYTLELKYSQITSSYIMFEIPVLDNRDPYELDDLPDFGDFDMEIAIGYNESSLVYNDDYLTKIRFEKEYYDGGNGLYPWRLVSKPYLTSDIFGSNIFGYIKPKVLTKNADGDWLLSIPNDIRNCSDNQEIIRLSGNDVTLVKKIGTITKS